MTELNKNKKITKKIVITLVVIAFIFLFYMAGYISGKLGEGKIELKVNPQLYQETDLPEMFSGTLLQQIWSVIKTDYVDQENIDEKELYYGALKGFVAGVGDPYTVLLDPETAKEFDQQISGEFEGIGAEIAIKDGIVTVVAPLPDTPADKAGLLAGDKIYAVDGTEVIGMSLDKVVRMIRGPKGTEVTLLIVRGDDEAKELIIARGVIELKSVKWSFRPDGLAYIELNSFNGDTTDLFNQAAAEIVAKKPKGIILDLRNNPGGLLDTAIDICSFWLDSEVAVIERFGDGRETEYKTENKSPLKGFPTVVLINKGSASGSEILAGAFQDYGIATTVGEQSFGKGSVQVLKKLPDGSSIKVTIAKWLTPKGTSINDQGIAPDVAVEITKEDFDNKKDPQLDKAVELLLKK